MRFARNKLAAGALALGALAVASVTAYAGTVVNGPFGFNPISGSAAGDGSDFNPAAPWIIPDGFSQHLVSNESDLNIYDGGRNDWNDMNTVNETGKQAGRYLYRTHEVRSGAEYGAQPNGAVSVVDLQTGETKILTQDPTFDALDGIEWTPWGTILFGEEYTGGRIFEIQLAKNDLMTAAAVIDRPAVGRVAHEGIQVDQKGNVYVVDEFSGASEGYGGGIYMFVPDTYGDLSSGNLYALQVTGPDGTGQGEWVGPIDPADARNSGTAAGGTGYNRPEDLQIIGDTLYAAITSGNPNGSTPPAYDGRVIAINLNSLEVTDFVKPGVNVPIEAGGATGFDNPDNLAVAPNGDLMIVEDNVPSDIWFASEDLDHDGAADSVHLFASLTDDGAEGTGLYFGKDPKTLFINVQHSKLDDGDATWAITKDN